MSRRYQKITKGCLAGVYKVYGKNQECRADVWGVKIPDMATFGRMSFQHPFKTSIEGLTPKDESSIFQTLGSRAKTNFGPRAQKLKNLRFFKMGHFGL